MLYVTFPLVHFGWYLKILDAYMYTFQISSPNMRLLIFFPSFWDILITVS